jgi:hypothetical protein
MIIKLGSIVRDAFRIAWMEWRMGREDRLREICQLALAWMAWRRIKKLVIPFEQSGKWNPALGIFHFASGSTCSSDALGCVFWGSWCRLLLSAQAVIFLNAHQDEAGFAALGDGDGAL